MKTKHQALLACRDAAGSDSQMARDLDVLQPRVWRWIHEAKQMDPAFVLKAERLYGVSRHELSPEIYPIDMAPSPEQRERFLGVDMDKTVA